jgi:uncharacterized protein (TIGR00730 family)
LDQLTSIAIFCGSGNGNNPIYTETAFELGRILANDRVSIIYGGSKLGVMGAVAEGSLQNGGHVIGVIPYFLRTKEVAHEQLSEMIVVDTMHERKMKMHELSDGIIALPGGWGTMEELFEMMTWGQLGLHPKPIGILNVNGFYDSLVSLMDKMTEEAFLLPVYRNMLLIEENIESLLERMRNYEVPPIKSWISPDKT